MDVRQALAERKSTRAFLDKKVEQEKIIAVLDAARHAPSGTNTQPWKVAVVTGDKLKQLGDAMEQAFQDGVASKMDYSYYPQTLIEPYKSRRKACGLQMYKTLEITREDKDRQREQWIKNYHAFDAPAALFFFIDKEMATGAYMDYGMFLQSLMLAAQEEGLATCPQAALAEHPDIVKKHLDYSQELILVLGIALGYEDKDALVNSYRTPREEVESFTDFFS